jgi:predicted nucleic acid-binding protein
MALFNKRDQDSKAAWQAHKHCSDNRWHLYTSNWTLYDAYSHLRERPKSGGLTTAEALKEFVRNNGEISVLKIDSQIEETALGLFWNRRDKSWSVTTCANIVLMEKHGLYFVLSGNHHYEEAGLAPLYSSGQ